MKQKDKVDLFLESLKFHLPDKKMWEAIRNENYDKELNLPNPEDWVFSEIPIPPDDKRGLVEGWTETFKKYKTFNKALRDISNNSIFAIVDWNTGRVFLVKPNPNKGKKSTISRIVDKFIPEVLYLGTTYYDWKTDNLDNAELTLFKDKEEAFKEAQKLSDERKILGGDIDYRPLLLKVRLEDLPIEDLKRIGKTGKYKIYGDLSKFKGAFSKYNIDVYQNLLNTDSDKYRYSD